MHALSVRYYMKGIKLIFIFLFFPSIFLLSCIYEYDADEGNELQIGDQVPSFTVSSIDGHIWKSDEKLGEAYMIVFFHTSCKDCRLQLSIVHQFHCSYPQFPIICISREEPEESVATYWKKEELTMPCSAQTDRSVYRLFAHSGIPRIYIVDKKGFIRFLSTDKPLATLDDLVLQMEVN